MDSLSPANPARDEAVGPESPPGYVVQTTSLTRRYDDRTVVDAIDLRVARGRVYGFLGPNGAGKTTTIRLLLGLIRPHGGAIRLFGDPFPACRIAALRRIGALVETPSLYGHLTGRENLEVTRRLLNVARGRIDAVLSIVRMEAHADRQVRKYSLGMKQRLALGRAMLAAPDLLILDEPTNGLDPAGIHEMRSLIRSLPASAGTTVFLSSHLLTEVEHVADDVGVLHRGRLVFQGTVASLRNRRGEHLMVRVGDTQAALRLLLDDGWDAATAEESGGIVVAATGDAAAARINRRLVDGGCDVYEIRPHRSTLEESFLTLTNDETTD